MKINTTDDLSYVESNKQIIEKEGRKEEKGNDSE